MSDPSKIIQAWQKASIGSPTYIAEIDPVKTPINKSWLYKTLYMYETSYLSKREFESIKQMLESDDPESFGIATSLIDIRMRELKEDIQAFKEIKKGQPED